MARRPILSSGSLNPFGGAGVSFDAFNVAASMGEQAYLAFRKKEVEWEAGRIDNDTYLAALQAYGAALPEGSEKFNAQNRYEETKSRIARNTLIGDIESGTKEWADLLTYDLAEFAKVTEPNSAAYDERLGNVRQVQERIFADEEETQRENYSDGRMTAAQLVAWYEDKQRGSLTDNNPDLDEEIGKRVADVKDIIVSERDQKMVNDFNSGKIGYNSFVAYATQAKGRYAAGTPQLDEWTERLADAKEQAIEQSITYRYGLSQRYDDLARFIKDHGTAPKGHTVTSGGTSGKKGTTRVIWNGSKWVTTQVGATAGTAGGTRYVGPSASEQKAWKDLQLEVAAAKKEMATIKAQVGRQPGGWVTTTDMQKYYRTIQRQYQSGSPEWYQVQERLDQLGQQEAKENVFKQKGLKVSYPRVSTEKNEFGTQNSQGGWAVGNLPPGTAAPAPAAISAAAVSTAAAPKPTAKAAPKTTTKAAAGNNDRQLGLDEFMKAIARVESGGRYDAVNKSSGARGKYQIMPANWAGWASKYLGNANAAWTPANQEKVAKGKMNDLYKWLGDWRAVAHWWLTGGSDAAGHRNPNSWSSSSRSYVNKVFAGMGMSPTQVSGSAYRAAATPVGGGAAGGGAPPTSPAGGYTLTGTGGGTAPRPASGTSQLPSTQFRIPKGLDAAQFERFYDRFLNAYESGEENFIDYSTGRAINYYIPADLDERSKLVGYLDQVRIKAFQTKAVAYAGSPSEEVAMTQYSDAIKKAGENQMLVLVTNQKPAQTYIANGFVIPSMGRPMTGTRNPNAINPIAEGLKLKAYAEQALATAAKNAKAALSRGDVETAYALIQHGINLAGENEALLRNYYTNAVGAIRSLKQTGAKVPEMVQKDLADLTAALDFDLQGGASPGYTNALQSLEETSGEIEKWVQFDSDDEPVTSRGASELDQKFQLKAGVDLYLKPNGEIEYKQTQFTGWTDRGTPSRDRDQYVTVSVKVGSSVKQVRAKWEASTIGFVAGTNVPIQGKLITGMMNGKEYAWVENPFAPGKWIRTNPNKPLSIKAPTGLAPFRNPDGTYSLEFSGKAKFTGAFTIGAGNKYRLSFDDEDGTYHVFSAPGMFQSEWTDMGSASSSSDLSKLYKDSGWAVDSSQFSGDDAHFFNSTGAWIGFSKSEQERAIRNTQSPRRLPGIPGHTIYGPGSSGYGAGPGARLPFTVADRDDRAGYQGRPISGGLSLDARDEAARDRAQKRSLPPVPASAADRAISRPPIRPIQSPDAQERAAAARPPTRSPDANERAAAAKAKNAKPTQKQNIAKRKTPAIKPPIQKQKIAARKTTPPKPRPRPVLAAAKRNMAEFG